ncbi:unnamed protein product [Penicillium manginii]
MRPKSRNDFAIAMICALPLEAEAVEALFDESYDRLGKHYGKQRGDTNAYINGRIGKHNVVLCYMPGMGKGSAASVASSLQISYPDVRLALLVGICGGAPSSSKHPEIFLGDVIISDSVIEYDFGRQYPGGLQRRTGARGTLGRPTQEIRALLNGLGVENARNELRNHTIQYLHILQRRRADWCYPGVSDILFSASYCHRHSYPASSAECSCFGSDSPDQICKEALEKDCDNLECDSHQQVRCREVSEVAPGPNIYIGPVASADTVMKSGHHRDEIVRKEKVIGFEMEGAGVWDNLPCIIIKGVCDYADSHKSKLWQVYAAATGASAAKAFLEYWMPRTHEDEHRNLASTVPSERGLFPSLSSSLVDSKFPTHSSASTKRKHKGDDHESTYELRGFVWSFYRYDYDQEFQRKARERHPLTCHWSLKNPIILRWLSCQSSSLLWLRGSPGAGKSTILTYLVEVLSDEGAGIQQCLREEDSFLIYSFCDTQLNSTTSSVLSTAIHQLLVKHPDQQELAMEVSDNISSGSPKNVGRSSNRPVRHLWTILGRIVRDSPIRILYFILDGLDECEKESQEELLELVASVPSSFKVLVSSRPSEYLRGIFSRKNFEPIVTYLELEDEEEHITCDIDRYIDKEIERIGKLRGYQPEHKAAASQTLKRDHSQLFLPVKLSMKKLENIPPGQLSRALEDLSKQLAEDLDAMYERMLHDMRPKILSKSCEIFKYLTYSRSPLTLDQLMTACPTGGGPRTDMRSDITNEDRDCFRKDLMLYGPIIRIRPDSFVEFVHISAKQFLQLPKSQQNFGSLLVPQFQAHKEIAIDCLRVLLFHSWKPAPEQWQDKWREHRQKFLEDTILLPYALRHWYEHLKDTTVGSSPDNIDKTILDLVNKLAGLWKKPQTAGFRQMILEGCGLSTTPSERGGCSSTLEVFSALGLAPFVEILLRGTRFPILSFITPHVKSALKLAIKGGHAETLELLSDNFGVTSLDGPDFQNIISEASRSGSPAVLRKALRMRKARVTEMVAAVIGASSSGNPALYNTTLEEISIFQARDRSNMTILHRLFADHFDSGPKPETSIMLAHEFIRKGVDVNAKDCIGSTALHYACHSRSLSTSRVIEGLIALGADPRCANKAGWTPFHLLARYTRDTSAIWKLVELGGNGLIEARTNSGRTALEWACQRESAYADTGGAIKALIDNGADPRALSLRDRQRHSIEMAHS